MEVKIVELEKLNNKYQPTGVLVPIDERVALRIMSKKKPHWRWPEKKETPKKADESETKTKK